MSLAMKLDDSGASVSLENEAVIFSSILRGDELSVRSILAQDPSQASVRDDLTNSTPLHLASYCNLPGVVEDVIGSAADSSQVINAKDSRLLTPLHRACRNNNSDVVLVLISHSADINARDKNWQTPKHIAAANNAVESLKLLLEDVNCKNVDIPDRAGRTCLHLAAQNNHRLVSELLLKHGADSGKGDKRGRTALHYASVARSLDVVSLLIDKNANVNAQDKEGMTPLHVASGKPQAFQDLGNGARRRYRPPASTRNVIKELCDSEADLRLQNCRGNTAIHTACANFNADALAELITAAQDDEDDVVLEMVNNRGETGLHVAAGAVSLDDEMEIIDESPQDLCVETLLNLNLPSINAKNVDGQTPLHMACINGCFLRVKCLIEKGADVNVSDKAGQRPLHLAAAHGHIMVVCMLLAAGGDPTAQDNQGRTSMHVAATAGLSICQKILESMDKISFETFLNARDKHGMTCLHYGVLNGDDRSLDYLITSGAKLEAEDSNGRTVIHYAAVQACYKSVVTLVQKGCDVNKVDDDGCTPLHYAFKHDMEGNIVEYLLPLVNEPYARDKNGLSPLHWGATHGNSAAVLIMLTDDRTMKKRMPTHSCVYAAAAGGHEATLRILLTNFVEEINHLDKESGLTPLEAAAKNGREDVLPVLVEFGSSYLVGQKSVRQTPLHLAATNNHVECVKFFLTRVEEKSDIVDIRGTRGNTPLMDAASKGRIEACRLLVDVGSDVNLQNQKGLTALYMAAANGHSAVCQFLTEGKADITLTDKAGKTAVHVAAMLGHVGILCTFLDVSVPLNDLLDTEQLSPLHWAAFKGHESCVQVLLSSYKSQENLTPAHTAAAGNKPNCLKLLLDQEALIHRKKDQKGRTPLHLAALHDSYECCKVLVSCGSDINCIEDIGQTPVMIAAMKGHRKLVEFFISKQCSLSAVDTLGNSVLHYGCMTTSSDVIGSSGIVDIILKSPKSKSINVSLQNKDGQSPLHLAASRGLVSATETLLMRGASVIATNNKGLSPALACAPNDSVVICLGMILSVLVSKSSSLDSTTLADISKSISSIGSSLSQTRLLEVEQDSIINGGQSEDAGNNSTFTISTKENGQRR